MNDIIIPEGLGEGDTFIHEGLRYTVKNDELTVRDLDLGEYIYEEPASRANTKAYKARALAKKHFAELERVGTVYSLSEQYEKGNGAKDTATVIYLTEATLYHLVALTHTPKGADLRVFMTQLFFAWRKRRLVSPEPAQAKTHALPGKKRELAVYEEEEYDALEAQSRRDAGIHNPTPFLVDARNALRIRYDHFVRRVDIPMRNVWLSARDARDALARIAPVLTRKEDGPSPYFQMDGGCHEASYLTLGQAYHMSLALHVEHHWQSVVAAFEAYDALLTAEVDQEIAWRKNREADAARLAATPTTFGLIESMTTRTESASAQVSGSVDALAEAVAKMSGLLTASLEQQAKRKWPVA